MIRRFAHKRHHDPEPEETERDQVRREPLPVARAILWKPLPDSYHLLASMMRAPDQQAQLFISQRAFLQVERHVRSAADLELGGFLAGHLCECPRSRTRYSVVDTVVPFVDVTGDPLGASVTQKGFDTVRRRLDAHRLALIGWYRSGSGLGLQLLPDDIETHLAYFNQPWQTTMLVMPDPAKPKGAFFTYDPRVGRGYCMPFYELFDVQAAESNRLDRTCVSWTTYVASGPVQPLAPADREVVETRWLPLQTGPEPQPPEPIDEWLEAIKDPWVRLKDVTVRPTRRDDPLPLADEVEVGNPVPIPTPLPIEPPASVRAPVEERGASADPIPLTTPPAQQKESPRPEPTRPAPPFAGPARSATTALARLESAPRTAERHPPRESAVPPAAAAPRPQPARTPAKPRPIRATTAAAMHKASTLSDTELPPDSRIETVRWQRRRRVGLAVAAVSFLGAIALSSVRSRSQTVAQAATSASVAEEQPAPIVAASENGHAPISLPSAVDSLAGALAYYRTVADDHRAGRVGCRVVDRAYALVNRARERVGSTRRQVAGHLGDADSIRVSMLGAEYTYVTQTHRRSGCQSQL